MLIDSIGGTGRWSPGNGVYGSSKAALQSIMHYFAVEWGSKNIRVNTINPGMVDTPLIHKGSITEEQMAHIRERHPEAYIDTLHYVREILKDPDYIFRDRRPNTGLVVKKIFNEEECSLLVLKIITSEDDINYKNSVITSWKITEKRLNNYLRNKEIIYKKA